MHNIIDNIKKLNELTNLTRSSLTESSVFSNLLKGANKILSATPITVDNDTKKLIKTALTIPINDLYRVMTYPGIHNTISMNITDPEILMKYVYDEINNSIKHPENEFNVDDIHEKSIAYIFSLFTRKQPINNKMTVDDFRLQYRKFIFASDKKFFILPDTIKISKTCMQIPITLDFINKKLLNRHVFLLNKYSKYMDSLKKSKNEHYSEYIKLIDMNISSIYRILLSMRVIFIDLDRECKSVLKRIISIHNTIDESVDLSDFNKHLNEFNFLHESTESESLNTKSESLSETKNYILNSYEELKKYRIDHLNNIKNRLWKISLINAEQLNLMEIKININNFINKPISKYNNYLDKIDMFIEVFSKELKYQNNQELFNIKNILNNITPDYFLDCIPKNDAIDPLSEYLHNIQESILGDNELITLDFNIIINNILTSVSLMEKTELIIEQTYNLMVNHLQNTESAISENIVYTAVIILVMLLRFYSCIYNICDKSLFILSKFDND